MRDEDDISGSSTSSEDSALDISKLKRGLYDSAKHGQLKARLKKPPDTANATETKVRVDPDKEVTPRRSESPSECDQRKVPGKQRVSYPNNVKAISSASTTNTSNNSHKNGQSSSVASDRKSSSRGSTLKMSISKLSPKPGRSTSQKNLHSTPIDKRFEGPENLDLTTKSISVIQRTDYLTAPRQVSEQPKTIASFDSFKKPELVTSRKQKKRFVQNVTMTMVTRSTRVATPRPPKRELKPFTRNFYETFSSQKSDTEYASYVSKSKILIAEQSKKLSTEQSTKQSKRLSAENIDQSKRSIIDQSKRSSTDQSKRSSTDQSKRSSTDQSKRSSTDQSKRSSTDQSKRSSTDQSKRSSTDQSKRSSTDQSKRSSIDQSRANVSETSSSITTNTSANLWDFKRNVTRHSEKIPGNSKSNIFKISSGETGENSTKSTGSSLQNEVISETLQAHSGPKAKANTEKSVLTQENLEQENNSEESVFSSRHSSGREDIPVSSKHVTLERLEQLQEGLEAAPLVFTHVTSQPDLEEEFSIFAEHSSETGRDKVSKKSSECSSWSSGDDAVVKELKNAKVDSVLCESDSGKESDSHSLNKVVNSPHQKRLLSKSKRNERSGITGTISSSSDASENDVIAVNSPPTQSANLMPPSSKSNGRPDESSHSGDINAISKKSATSDLRKSVRKETCSVPSEKTSQGSQKQNAIMTKDLEPKFAKVCNTRPSLKPVVVLERMVTRNSKHKVPNPIQRPSEDNNKKSSSAVIVNKGLNRPTAALSSLQENSPIKDNPIEGVSVPKIVISKRSRAPSVDSCHSLQDNPSYTLEIRIGHSQPTKSSSTKLKPKAVQKLHAHIMKETESPEERARPILRGRRRKGVSGASVSKTASFNPSQIYAPFISSRFLHQNQSSTSVAVGGAKAPNRFENEISRSTFENIPSISSKFQPSILSPGGKSVNREIEATSVASSPAGRRKRPADAAIENSSKSSASSPAGQRNRPADAGPGTGSHQPSAELYTSSPLRTRRQLEVDNEKKHPTRPKPSGSLASTTSLPTKTVATKGNRSMQLKHSEGKSFTTNKKSKLRPSEQHIKHLQATFNLLIPKLSFHRIIKECAANINAPDFRFTWESLGALQETAESYLIGMFEDSYLLALHAKRKTLLCKDMVLARRIRGNSNY